jgi:hypothetical protein
VFLVAPIRNTEQPTSTSQSILVEIIRVVLYGEAKKENRGKEDSEAPHDQAAQDDEKGRKKDDTSSQAPPLEWQKTAQNVDGLFFCVRAHMV